MKCPKCKTDNPDSNKFCSNCGTSLTAIPATLTSPPPEKEGAPEKSALDFAPGQYFGNRYQIIEEIGRGGMGRVYKAVDKELSRIVALKMIKPEISSHPGIVERFKKEIKLASQITHKNVCRIYDLGDVDGIKFISMQYIEGQDLNDFIKQTGKLPVDKAIAITTQICAALQAAHDEGVIHRDLKPKNIMLDKKGNAYVMDFGIARSLEAEEVTKPGVVIGTPHYMSPEQGEGKTAYARSDIYSLGCILYEMLTGKPPFEADASASLIHKHLKEVPKPPSKLNPRIPQEIEIIILKCMEKKSERRYQRADEVIRAINESMTDIISEAKPLKLSWKLYITIASIILIGMAIGFYYFLRKEKLPTPLIPKEWKNSIAVLPFEDLSPQKDQEYFSDGMTDEIIGKLAKLRELKVISRTSVMLFKDKKKNIKEIGQELGVETILEGSVRKEEENIRISAQLINVEDGFHLWSETYDRKLNSIFAIQDEISQAIVNALRIKLGSEEKTTLVKSYTEDIESYNLYLKGRYYREKRTEESLKKAIKYFQQAIERDPTYAMAYTGIANSYGNLGWYNLLPIKEAFPKARAAAEKAMEIDSNLAEAHTSLATIIKDYYWDWSAAEREFKRAIELNPGYASAHHWYAEYLSYMGRHDEAIAEGKRALELDPLSLIINTIVGLGFYWARQYDRAIEQHQKVLEMDPNFTVSYWTLGMAYAQKGMYNEAIAEAQEAIELSGGRNILFLAYLGNIYAFSGKKDKANEVLNELLERSKQRYVSSYLIALIYLGLGEKDTAFQWLEKAYEERDHWLTWLKVDPLLDSLLSDQRFKALLKKMNLE